MSTMSTTIEAKLGPSDRGRRLSLRRFLTSRYQEGFRYELIDGRLAVSPAANPPENIVDIWLLGKVTRYAEEHPRIINYVTNKARVFVPDVSRITAPEPDLAAYKNFPLHLPFKKIRWHKVSPLLVAEILGDDAEKDLVRNVEFYLKVPSIKEYWVFDIREDPDRPSLRVHRHHGPQWRIIDLQYGDTYTTSLLPGFELVIDPRK